jgi:hypothetical protein
VGSARTVHVEAQWCNRRRRRTEISHRSIFLAGPASYRTSYWLGYYRCGVSALCASPIDRPRSASKREQIASGRPASLACRLIISNASVRCSRFVVSIFVRADAVRKSGPFLSSAMPDTYRDTPPRCGAPAPRGTSRLSRAAGACVLGTYRNAVLLLSYYLTAGAGTLVEAAIRGKSSAGCESDVEQCLVSVRSGALPTCCTPGTRNILPRLGRERRRLLTFQACGEFSGIGERKSVGQWRTGGLTKPDARRRLHLK